MADQQWVLSLFAVSEYILGVITTFEHFVPLGVCIVDTRQKLIKIWALKSYFEIDAYMDYKDNI